MRGVGCQVRGEDRLVDQQKMRIGGITPEVVENKWRPKTGIRCSVSGIRGVQVSAILTRGFRLSTATAAPEPAGRHLAAATPRRSAESLGLSGRYCQVSLSSLGWKAQPSSRGGRLRRGAGFGKAEPLRKAARQSRFSLTLTWLTQTDL